MPGSTNDMIHPEECFKSDVLRGRLKDETLIQMLIVAVAKEICH